MEQVPIMPKSYGSGQQGTNEFIKLLGGTATAAMALTPIGRGALGILGTLASSPQDSEAGLLRLPSSFYRNSGKSDKYGRQTLKRTIKMDDGSRISGKTSDDTWYGFSKHGEGFTIRDTELQKQLKHIRTDNKEGKELLASYRRNRKIENRVNKLKAIGNAQKPSASRQYLNSIPGASGEGIGPIRKRNYVASDEKLATVKVKVDKEKTGIKHFDDLIEALDLPEYTEEFRKAPWGSGEKASRQQVLNKKWDKFKADIAENGIKDPVVVGMKDGRLVVHEGNHRLTAANELGIDVPIKYTDDVPTYLKLKE